MTTPGLNKENEMNKLVIGLSLAALAGIVAGCVTDPLKYAQTPRDKEVFEAKDERPEHDGQYKIAVVSRMNSACHVEPFILQTVSEQVERAITENFSNLGWFETVDRKNGVALISEGTLKGDSIDATSFPGADIVLIADSFVYYYKKEDRPVATAGQAFGVKIETDFRMIDLETKQPILAKKFSNVAFGNNHVASGSDVIEVASRANARQYAKIVAARFLPGVRVIQTRGNGRFAQIGLGKNYLAADGSKIEFFVDEKQKNGKFDENVFAQGVVLGQPGQHLENSKAWVEVQDYESAGVHQGNKARVTED